MSSFPDRINELLRLLGSSASAVNAKQGDRVYNFHYHPREWTEFRQQLPILKKRLNDQGYTPHLVSFGETCLKIFKESRIYAGLVKTEGLAVFPHRDRNKSLYSVLAGGHPGKPLTKDSPIVAAIKDAIDEASREQNGVLILVDTETIHPLFRVSALEQILQGCFVVPTIICYPGERGSIGDNPSFLGFYKSDGNYRSTHIY